MAEAILDNLHPELVILWESMGPYGRPATTEELSELLDSFSGPPDDYLELVRQHCFLALETRPGYSKFFTIALIPPPDVVGWSEWYPWLHESLPDAFCFGTDGDSCYLLGDNGERTGVFKMGISTSGWGDAEYLAPSIRALLCDGAGWATSSEDQQ